MNYWGNDIVVIENLPALGDERMKRWIAKVCTPQERNWLRKSKRVNRDRWYLWSCKESVYKVLRKTGAERFLNPKRIDIFIEKQTEKNAQNFKALFNGQEFWGTSTWRNNWIHSICCNQPMEGKPFHADVMLTGTPKASNDIRKKVKEVLFNEYQMDIEEIIQSKYNIPTIICRNSKLNADVSVDLSFSHDGDYSAYLIHVAQE